MSGEIERSLKYLERQENKWLNNSLPVIAFVRRIDPATGKGLDQSLATWISRLNQSYVLAAQSLRRAAALYEPDSDGMYGDTMANAYLTEADRATTDLAGMTAAALDRLEYLRQQLPEHQAQQIAAGAAEGSGNASGISQAER